MIFSDGSFRQFLRKGKAAVKVPDGTLITANEEKLYSDLTKTDIDTYQVMCYHSKKVIHYLFARRYE